MEIDVELLTMGYLVSPDGCRYRHVPQLDIIARDCSAAGVTVRWGVPARNRRGWAYLWSREIVLAWQLYYRPGWELRECLAHELGHVVTGRCSDDWARAWQQRYAGLLIPAWAS